MAAANRGARDARALSIGLSIRPAVRGAREPVDRPAAELPLFFIRKVMFVATHFAFVALPGGFGTLDELFECLTLIQTRKISYYPVLLVGRDYWSPLVDWLRDRVLAGGKISEQDLELFQIVEGPDEVVAAVQSAAIQQRERRR